VGTPERDPRGRTISIIYYTILDSEKPIILAGDDAAEAAWFSMKNLPELAFDHAAILQNAIEKITAIIK
jgi:8-oxo-dGTP diphosphatase